jgi:hypothetical protein
MISPQGIGRGIQVLNYRWLLPFQAVDDFFQVDQQ